MIEIRNIVEANQDAELKKAMFDLNKAVTFRGNYISDLMMAMYDGEKDAVKKYFAQFDKSYKLLKLYKDNEMFIMSKLEVNSDNNIMISDWTDIGKPAGLYRYGYYRSSIAFTDLYPDSKVKTCPSCISTESQMGGNVKYIAVGYETTDGYISNSLHHILKHDRLFEMHKLEYFPLPIKL